MDHNRKLTTEYELQRSQYHALRHHLKVLWEQMPPSHPAQDDHSGEADDLPTPRPDMVHGKQRDPQERPQELAPVSGRTRSKQVQPS